MDHTRSPRATPSCATLATSTTCVGRQRKRGFMWTIWRTRSWTPECSWPWFATALTLGRHSFVKPASARELVSQGGDSRVLLQEKRRPEYLEGLPEKMKLYSEFLGKRPWFAGDKVTYVDFLAYDILDQHRIFEPKCLDAFPNLKDFLARFEGLKKIADYRKSGCFLPKPIFAKIALWNPK
ncbi:glutathione S-transferase Mu 2-like [Meriones unguiculatus]|uniref:glutathione S-transferase Mu 2-like n=1 Tax=Meriones unguiculatus TaxID=10047 RepID=UPI00293E6296|nr:glutathione S-transferase Mu 2-like [Meriones unguiculatus]XP_060248884.1 glutathione S-transferase Mu 2-like [Meriones unguiculatus]